MKVWVFMKTQTSESLHDPDFHEDPDWVFMKTLMMKVWVFKTQTMKVSLHEDFQSGSSSQTFIEDFMTDFHRQSSCLTFSLGMKTQT